MTNPSEIVFTQKIHSQTFHSQPVLDGLKPTLYSLDSHRGKRLIEQFLHPPSSLNFELGGRGVYFVSDRCNLHCTYCKGLASEIVPPDLDEFEAVVRGWSTRKLKYLHLTGLEPTVSKCLIEYLKIAQKYHVAVSLSTNGYQDFSTYRELVRHGVKYLAISLDAHNETLAQQMGRQEHIYSRVSNTIQRLVALKQKYDLKIVICLAITKANFYLLPEIVADFLEHLHPDDIRLIPVAQEVFTEQDRAYYHSVLQPKLLALASERYPFLRYRINNFFSVRGLHHTSVKKCYVVLDERTVGGKSLYPCNIYIRERGKPITSLSDPHQNETVWRWFLQHNSLEDPICTKYCCDVTREYNLMLQNYVDQLTEQGMFQPSRIITSILQEPSIQNIFHQLHETEWPFKGLAVHLQRTSLNAGYLGMSLNWHEITVYYAMRAALLHDVGKLHPAIRHLNCEQALDAHTKRLFRGHVNYGRILLSQMGYCVEGNIAFHHHERIDGTGYHKIPLKWPMAELVGLSDAYTALTEDRGHRESFSPAQAIEMIRAGECGRFREAYVDTLQHCYEQHLLC